MSYIAKLKKPVSHFIDWLNDNGDDESTKNGKSQKTEHLKKYDDYENSEEKVNLQSRKNNNDLNKSKFESLLNREHQSRLRNKTYVAKDGRDALPKTGNKITKKFTTSSNQTVSTPHSYNSQIKSCFPDNDILGRLPQDQPSHNVKNTTAPRENIAYTAYRVVNNFIKNVFVSYDQELQEMKQSYVENDVGNIDSHNKKLANSKRVRKQQAKERFMKSEGFRKLKNKQHYDKLMAQQLESIFLHSKEEIQEPFLQNDNGEHSKDTTNDEVTHIIKELEVENDSLRHEIVNLKLGLKSVGTQLDLEKLKTEKLQTILRKLQDNDPIIIDTTLGTEKSTQHQKENDTYFKKIKKPTGSLNSDTKLNEKLVVTKRNINNLPEARLRILDPLPVNLSPEKQPLFTSSPTRKPSDQTPGIRLNHLKKFSLDDSEKEEDEDDDHGDNAEDRNDDIDSIDVDHELNIDESDVRFSRTTVRETNSETHSKATSLSPVRFDHKKYHYSSPDH